jgi:hypothetical protein
MERIARRVRRTRMMDQRRSLRGSIGLVGAGLLVAALAGCGSVVASGSGSGSATAPAAGAGAGTSATAPAAASAVGCGSVDQATAVSIRRLMRLQAPEGSSPVGTTMYHQVSEVRALFGQLCAAVTHPAKVQVMHCPADFGTEYLGTFYDGTRVLATFAYASTGCARASVTADGKTQATMVYGRAYTAAPHLAADLAAILGGKQKPGLMQPQGSVNPGGTNMPA